MGVVYVYRRLFGQVVKRSVLAEMTLQNILYGRRNKEILLTQAERFPLRVIVLRVQNLADDLSHCLPFECAHIVALIEGCHIYSRGLRAPEAQHVDAFSVRSCHHEVIRHGAYRREIFKLDIVMLTVPRFLNSAAEVYIDRRGLTLYKPNAAAGKPEIGHFGLPAVNKFLTEDTEFILYAVAHGRISAGGKTVKEAGGKPAQSAVAESCIRLKLVKILKLYAVFGKCLAEHLVCAEVVKIVFKRTSHEEFHREVVHHLAFLF